MPKLPGWVVPVLVLTSLIALLPPALISRARATKSTSPRINIIPDMDFQPRFLPQTENEMYLDGRSMRPRMEGTIARGALREDDHFDRGQQNGEWATAFPMEVTRQVMNRGRERFEIYCAPCHGVGGYGDGMVSRRASELTELGHANWTPPTSMHDELVRERPVGHLFNTITHGIRNMPPYGSQIKTADRWAVVAYVKALQRSQNATLSDVPPDARPALQ